MSALEVAVQTCRTYLSVDGMHLVYHMCTLIFSLLLLGCGKTTLLDILTGRRKKGTISVC